jgi:AraC family transcriptional regulator, regulatory protein of adaptative response / methylphosphotriester-DNA alkyltransferase methyltransferase
MNDEQWRAIVECDPSCDGRFFYGVLTTGIFCKPSCKSRTPKREHVRIFASADEALRAGLRPCKRCQPHRADWRSPDEELALRVKQLIADCFPEPLTLGEIASRLHVSPYYLQRCFTRLMNCSPAQYLVHTRIEAAKRLLAETRLSIAEVAMQVGFRTRAYFAHVFHKQTKQTPTQYRTCAERNEQEWP